MPRRDHTSRARIKVLLVFAMLGCMLSCCAKRSKQSETTQRPRPATNIEPVAVTPAPEKPGAEPDIRVAIMKDQQVLKISGGKARKIGNSAGILLHHVPDESLIQITPGAQGLVINGKQLTESAVSIISSNRDERMSVNDQDVGSRLFIYRASPASGLTVVAALNLETYLSGVLAGEVPFERWHPEALRAQAITSRSYALYQMKQNVNQPYDVENTVMSQVFKTGYSNNPILSSAIGSTRGQALTSSGAIFSAYFHSTCGDHTESSANIFPDHAQIRPLSGANCGFCSQSPAYRWRYVLSKAALEQKLAAQNSMSKSPRPNAPVGKIDRIEFLDASGSIAAPMTRVAQVRIYHAGGVIPMQGNQFRLLVSAKELKSLMFESVADHGDSIEITGGGFGHGVGLCQWGSQGMAQGGFSHLQILGKYFPGAALTKMY